MGSARGIPARFILGDTIRMTVTAEWKNLQWFRGGEDQRIRVNRMIEFFKTEPEQPPPAPPTSFVEMVKSREVNGQFQLDF